MPVPAYHGFMPAWMSPSRAACFAGVLAIVAASVVVLATGSSVAHLGPALVGGAALGTLVALLLPHSADPDQSQPDLRNRR